MADSEFPALGFDPLPGEPMIILALRDDARAFGARMTEEAQRLGDLARPGGWEGAAAEAYAAGLDHLPRDLQRCGDAFADLAGALERYYDCFIDAQLQARELERCAAEARARLQAAEGVGSVDDTGATGELGAILREAHGFGERFDESVDDIARAIRRLTAFAPDQPLFAGLTHWAAKVFGLSLADHSGDPADALAFFSGASYRSVAERAEGVQAWAKSLTDEQWDALIAASPHLVGPTSGIPYARRYQANRLLIERSRADTSAAAEEARRKGDAKTVTRLERRERCLKNLLAERGEEPRQFLLFDNSGDGRVVEVFGDLETADNVATMVPGMANTLDNYDRLADNTERLRDEAALRAPDKQTATVAWLGYDTPGFSGVLFEAEAKVGAGELCGFNDGLLLRDEVATTVVAHSYGSLVTGIALRDGLQVDNVAVVGSPGIGVGSIKDLHLPPGTDLWAARAPLDPVALSEWHGTDPTDPRFGGRRFVTGEVSDDVFPSGHSAYFEAGSDSLRNLALIATDQDQLVSELAPSLLDRGNMSLDQLQGRLGDFAAEGSAAFDAAQERVDATLASTQAAVDRGQAALGDVLEGVPGGGVGSDLINAPIDSTQALGEVVHDAGQNLIDAGQDAVDGMGRSVGETVDVGQELADKAGDIVEDAGDAAEGQVRKVRKWLGDKWPG